MNFDERNEMKSIVTCAKRKNVIERSVSEI